MIFDVKDVYYLEVRLQYEVVEEKAQARFDRKRKEVKITLPVIQSPEVKFEISPDVILEVDEVKDNRETERREEKKEVVEKEKVSESHVLKGEGKNSRNETEFSMKGEETVEGDESGILQKEEEKNLRNEIEISRKEEEKKSDTEILKTDIGYVFGKGKIVNGMLELPREGGEEESKIENNSTLEENKTKGVGEQQSKTHAIEFSKKKVNTPAPSCLGLKSQLVYQLF